jgi:hypothetical protein
MKIQDEKELQQLSLFFDVEGWTASNWISRSPIFLSFKKGLMCQVFYLIL